MDDILLLSSRDSNAAALWVEYLTTCFEQITRGKPNAKLRVYPLCAEDLPRGPCPELVRRIRGARLLLIVLCPRLLQRCASSDNGSSSETSPVKDSSSEEIQDVSDGMGALTARMSADRVIAAMLGVKDTDVKEQHRKAFTSYDHWTRLEVQDQDQSFVGCLLRTAMSIVTRPTAQSAANGQKSTTPGDMKGHDEVDSIRNDDPALHQSMDEDAQNNGKGTFSVQPKKVRYGQTRILALLTDPMTSQDTVEVCVERDGIGDMVRAQNVRKRNPYTVQFTVPDACLTQSCLLTVHLRVSGRAAGPGRPVKCEGRTRELERAVRESLARPEGLWELLGLPGEPRDRDRLDAALARALQENTPPDFHLMSGPRVDELGCAGISGECPTLLHFAARHGLERCAARLLDGPGGGAACARADSAGRRPADLARLAGHHRLAGVLQGYMQMNELTSMYAYLKGISTTGRTTSESHDTSTDTMGYLDMNRNDKTSSDNDNNNTDDSMSEQCCRLLEEKGPAASADGANSEEDKPSVRSASQNSSSCSNGDYANACAHPDADYCLQPSNIPVLMSTNENLRPTSVGTVSSPVQSGHNMFASTSTLSGFSDYLTHPCNMRVYPGHHQTTPKSVDVTDAPVNLVKVDVHQSAPQEDHEGAVKMVTSSPDDELAEIIKDFRRGARDLAEVERLAEQWRTRHARRGADTQRERDRLLRHMRQQYELLQRTASGKEGASPGAGHGKVSAIDRVRRLFGRTKGIKVDGAGDKEVSPNQDEDTSNVMEVPNQKISGVTRPMSSLSIHSVSSSSSSGRLSTGSVCSGASLGDSGTHSDNEDRKISLKHLNCDTAAARKQQLRNCLDNYLVPPAPRPLHLPIRPTLERFGPDSSTQHYIRFPSNQPVTSSNRQTPPLTPVTPQTPPLTMFTSADYGNLPAAPLNTIQEAREYVNFQKIG